MTIFKKMAIALLSAAALSAGAAAPAAAANAKDLVLFNFENWGDPPFTAEYKKKYGAEPKYVIFADEDEAFSKMRGGFKPDVMGPCSYEFGRWQEANLLRPIDVAKLSNWAKIPASLKNIPGMWANAQKTQVWFVPQYWANTSVTYRKDLAPEYAAKESYNILFDQKYKRRVAALDGVDDTVTLIAKAKGLNAYTMTPAQWVELQKHLREFVRNARFISSDETSLSQALASGEVVAAITWNQTWAALKREGVNVGFMNPPGGMFTYVCGLVMHKDTKDAEKSHALIDSGIATPAAKYMVEKLSNGPANTSVMAGYTDKQLADFGLPRDVDAFLKQGTFQIRLKNKDAIVKAWTEMRAGGR
jgi:spermidine/putrescine transport system substrate-binding protein